MSAPDFLNTIVEFVRQHQVWGPLLIGLLAFGESIAVISLFIPATIVIITTGGLIGLGELPLWPFCAGAAIGAALGDILSYELGRYYGPAVLKLWPFCNYPKLIERSEIFFGRYGVLGVALGRFLGPLRAFVPLCAGIAKMKRTLYLPANFFSAPVWAFFLLAPGALGLPALFH